MQNRPPRAWDFVIDWLAFKVPRLSRLIYRPPVRLIRDGRIIQDAVERELVTREELASALRQLGVWDMSQVAEAQMEGNGSISVRTREDHYGRGAPGGRGQELPKSDSCPSPAYATPAPCSGAGAA